MKKKVKLILLTIILICIIFFSPNFIYKTSDKFFGFPIPIKAKLMKEVNQTKGYRWWRASEENGIPADYKIMIKLNGWEKGEQEGACTVYTKENHTVELCSFNKELYVANR